MGFAAHALALISTDLDFWWELALLVVILLPGHWIEMRSIAQTSSALDSLAELLPDHAELVVGERIEHVSPADLGVGDLVLVRLGGRVPADVIVADGVAAAGGSCGGLAVLASPGGGGAAGLSADEVAAVAAGVEAESEHPLARAIPTYVGEDVRSATRIRAVPGVGVQRHHGWRHVRGLGSAAT